MGNEELGRLEEVNLREYWAREDTHFTPWLASQPNMELLAGVLGIEVEVEETEANVGPFRADILCREVGSDNYVLIENQLERTDHTHLGQIITYAAGLDAVSVVWVSANFTEEHRSAIDWLNRITLEGFNFFGVEVELWRIGNSPPAPRFNIVAKPNEWSKSITAGSRRLSSTKRSERANLYREFWGSLSEYLVATGAPFRLDKPSGSHWIELPLSINNLRLIVSYSFPERRMKAFLTFQPKNNIPWFEFVNDRRETLERALGEEITWFPATENQAGYAKLSSLAQSNSSESVTKLFQWLVEKGTAVKKELGRMHLAYSETLGSES